MEAGQYTQVSQHEHVLLRPGLYIGSVSPEDSDQWVFDGDAIVRKRIRYTPGLLKIISEVLSNAADHIVRLKKTAATGKAVKLTKSIKVDVDLATGRITVVNDGSGIPCDIHEPSGLRTPELVFGCMLSSSNYNDDEERCGIGGTFGIGCKACNIFSKEFEVATVDDTANKIYSQSWSDNMHTKTPGAMKAHRTYPFTRVSFVPDYERLGCSGIDADLNALITKYVYDLAAMTDPGVSVHLNGTKLPVRSFERYADMYIGARGEAQRFFEKSAEGLMEVVVACSSAGFQHVSFVNGLHTSRGGRHVDAVVDKIVAAVTPLVLQRKKKSLKPSQIKENLMLFVSVTIPNPSFDSQTKELLTTPQREFGFKVEVSTALADKIYKSDIVGRALAANAATEEKTLAKTDGKMRARITGLPKLEDAEFAGTARSDECVLLLTEGDSAKSSVIAGLSEVGRQKYGVFPLRGKPINVLEASTAKLAENEELSAIKKILGLTSNKDYGEGGSSGGTSGGSGSNGGAGELRYGSVWIVSDQDHDGTHIRGLLINVFATLWPSLIRRSGFLRTMQTPIVKAKRGADVVSFYSIRQYEDWAAANPEAARYTIKHYKGLGTSSAEEAREWFRVQRTTTYQFDGIEDSAAIDKAFNKKRADDRKQWLGNFDPASCVGTAEPVVTYREFIDRELIVFANYDVLRSIPSMVDGLKPSQRKILYACFKRKLTTEVRVAQLASSVSEITCYHHGEVSLQGAIICMAQDFVGSNNANLLVPHGQFGTRILGGKDAASPRYIHTHLDPLAFAAFVADDSAILKYEVDDGEKVEPTFFAPVVPMVLINGAIGIGTGFSTTVPSFDPVDVIAAVRAEIDGEEIPSMVPWYRGFKGDVVPANGTSFVTRGIFERSGGDTVDISELPVGTWSDDYKEFLEDMVAKQRIRDYQSMYTDTDARFKVRFPSAEALEKALTDRDAFAKEMKLVSKPVTTSNMHLYAADGRIKRYERVQDIVVDFAAARKHLYVLRKASLMEALTEEARLSGEKARFVGDVVEGRVAVMNVARSDLEASLEALGYVRGDEGFSHLTKLPIHSLTTERRADLEQKAAAATARAAELDATPVEAMWKRDLDSFQAAWEAHLAGHTARYGKTSRTDPAAPAAKRVRKTKA
jgi:DNA topoisomerase II